MDKTILGAIIGASAAILINGIIFILSRRNDLNKEKIQIISELISCLYIQLRYSKRYIGHQIWLNYYNRALRIISKPELKQIAHGKVEYRIKLIEDIETSFIQSDSRLAILNAKYRSIFPKENEFLKKMKKFTEYVISDNIEIENFENWSDEVFIENNIADKITDEENKTLKKLETSFVPLVNELIGYLEKKI